MRRREGHGVGSFSDFDGDGAGPAAQSLAGARDGAGERIVGEGEVAREKGKVAGKQGGQRHNALPPFDVLFCVLTVYLSCAGSRNPMRRIAVGTPRVRSFLRKG